MLKICALHLRLLVAVSGGVVLLALWCGALWRCVPRVESFEAEAGSVSDEPFTGVFDPAPAMPRAEAVLSRPILSVTEKSERAPSNDPRDYVSLSIYWWPNPVTRVPYVHRDGRRNPEADRYDAPKLRSLASDVEALGAAFAATGDVRFAHRATEQLRAWFITPETRMNPHLTFAQMMPGWAAGGRQGIIEGLPLTTRLPAALAQLDAHGAFTAAERRALRDWLGRYLAWLRHSRAGRSEHARPNNHGTWHDVQVATLATSLGLDELAAQVVRDSLSRIDTQFLADGRQPEELRRTKSFEYSCYSLDAWLHLAALGKRFGIEVWNHRTAAGASPSAGPGYLTANAAAWPHPQLSPPARASLEALARRAKSFAAASPPR